MPTETLSLFADPLDAHISRYRIEDIQRVCATCRACPHLASCGGGYLPHRFNGLHFDNPSIYCDALYALSERMMEALRVDLPPRLRDELDSAGARADAAAD